MAQAQMASVNDPSGRPNLYTRGPDEIFSECHQQPPRAEPSPSAFGAGSTSPFQTIGCTGILRSPLGFSAGSRHLEKNFLLAFQSLHSSPDKECFFTPFTMKLEAGRTSPPFFGALTSPRRRRIAICLISCASGEFVQVKNIFCKTNPIPKSDTFSLLHAGVTVE